MKFIKNVRFNTIKIILCFNITITLMFAIILSNIINSNNAIDKVENNGFSIDDKSSYFIASKTDYYFDDKDMDKLISLGNIEVFTSIEHSNELINFRLISNFDNNNEFFNYKTQMIESVDNGSSYIGKSLSYVYIDNILINDYKYNINGVIGLNNVVSKNDNCIVAFSSNIEEFKNLLNSEYIKKGIQINIYNSYNKEAVLKNITEIFGSEKFYIDNISNEDELINLNNKKNITLNLFLYLLFIFNIIVISWFWVDSKRKAISIKQYYGAENKVIICETLTQVLKIFIFSSISALIISFPISYIFSANIKNNIIDIISVTTLILIILIILCLSVIYYTSRILRFSYMKILKY